MPIIIESGFYSNILVKYLVEEFNMDLKYIKYKLIANKVLKHDTFKEFLLHIFSNYSDDGKILCNSFIGMLGQKYKKHSSAVVCGLQSAFDLYAQNENNNTNTNTHNVTIENFDNSNELFIVKNEIIKKTIENNNSIHRFVISMGILNLLKMINKINKIDNKIKIYGFNTDGVFIKYSDKINNSFKVKNKDYKFNINDIGKTFITSAKLNYIEKNYRTTTLNLNDYKINK